MCGFPADVKPSNIIRVGTVWKLANLGAAAAIKDGFAGNKYSTSFCPPELIALGPRGEPVIKAGHSTDEGAVQPGQFLRVTYSFHLNFIQITFWGVVFDIAGMCWGCC
jgi:hypothetical protein